jgi:hypothetical protein
MTTPTKNESLPELPINQAMDEAAFESLVKLSGVFRRNGRLLDEAMGREIGEARIWRSASNLLNNALSSMRVTPLAPVELREQMLRDRDPQLYVHIRGPVDQFGCRVIDEAALTREAPTVREVVIERGLETPRRMKAVETLLADGWKWDGEQWTRPPAPQRLADYPGCSGDPASCPENEGHGCCKPNPVCSCPSGDGSLRHPCPVHPQRLAQGESDRTIQAKKLAEPNAYASSPLVTNPEWGVTTQPPHQDRGEVEQRECTEWMRAEWKHWGGSTQSRVTTSVVMPEERYFEFRASIDKATQGMGAALTEAKQQGPGEAFQSRVSAWMDQCFVPSLYSNMVERGDRLLEEVLELLQSTGYDRTRVGTLTEYVYGRPAGEPSQEVGGVMVTLAGFCWIAGLDMHGDGERELARITQPEVMDKIRRKQEAKNALHFDTPLPGQEAPQVEAKRQTGEGE